MTDAVSRSKQLHLLCWMVLSLVVLGGAALAQASARAESRKSDGGASSLPSMPSQALSYPGERILLDYDRYGPGDEPALERLRRDRSLDRRFGKRARASIERSQISVLDDAFVQPSGRILITGERLSLGPPVTTVMVVARLRSDGGLDRSFAGRGWRVVDLEGPFQAGTAVAAMPGGRVVAAGSDGYGGREGVLHPSFVIALRPNGSADASFGGEGIVRLPTHAPVEDLVPSRRGSILAAASFNDFELFRLRPDGGLSAGFGDAGRVVVDRAGVSANESLFTPLGEIGQAADGSILIAGGSQFISGGKFHYGMAAVRYRPDGKRDLTYGSKNGFARAWFKQSAFARGMAIQPSGRIVVVGGTSPSRGASAMVAMCLNPAGRFQAGFGKGGKVMLKPEHGSDGNGAVFQAGRMVVLVGGNGRGLALVRLRIRPPVR